jgi:ATP-dependent Clp protease ATP-binding subunit ClpX
MFEIPSQNCESITITKEYAESKMDRLTAQKLRA